MATNKVIDGDEFRSPRGVWSTNLPSDAVAQVSFGEFKKYMASEIKDIKLTICEEISASINKVEAKTDRNTKTITEIRNDVNEIKKAANLENLRKEVTNIINSEMNKENRTGTLASSVLSEN